MPGLADWICPDWIFPDWVFPDWIAVSVLVPVECGVCSGGRPHWSLPSWPEEEEEGEGEEEEEEEVKEEEKEEEEGEEKWSQD